MLTPLDDRLQTLSRTDYDAALDGLESAVLARAERNRLKAALPSTGVQLGLAAAALAFGLVIGLSSGARPTVYGAEVRVLSDATMLAPSMRLGGA
jgi:hypothetical protein